MLTVTYLEEVCVGVVEQGGVVPRGACVHEVGRLRVVVRQIPVCCRTH